jgi:hypothetical protein
VRTFTIEIHGQAVQVYLEWVGEDAAPPAAVQPDTDSFVSSVDCVDKDLLDPRVLRERDVRALVEDETAGKLTAGGMSADVDITVVDDLGTAGVVQAMTRAEGGESGTDDDNGGFAHVCDSLWIR